MSCSASQINPVALTTYKYDPTNTNSFTGAVQSSGCNAVTGLNKVWTITLTGPLGFTPVTCTSSTGGTTFDFSGSARAIPFTCATQVGKLSSSSTIASTYTLVVASTTFLGPSTSIVFGALAVAGAQSSTAYSQKRSRPESDMWLHQATRSDVMAQIEARAEAEKRKAATKHQRRREVNIKGRMGGWASMDKLD